MMTGFLPHFGDHGRGKGLAAMWRMLEFPTSADPVNGDLLAPTAVEDAILAHVGGGDRAYFECVDTNHALPVGGKDEVEAHLPARMLDAWDPIVADSLEGDESLRPSATALSVQPVAVAHQPRPPDAAPPTAHMAGRRRRSNRCLKIGR